MIPLVCTVRIDRRDGRRHRIWIPLFLLWPFIIVLIAIAEMFVMVGCAVLLFKRPREAVKIALALPTIVYLLFQAVGLRVDVAELGHQEVRVELS
jgi:hypothetical protein